MAPTRPNNRKAKSKSRPLRKNNTPPQKTIRQIYADATTALTQGDAAAARSTAQQALDAVAETDAAQLPMRTALHTLLGEACLELGDPDSARRHFSAAVDADPDGALPEDQGGGGGGGGVEKFLYLAQLSEVGGSDSVRWYERGAEVLRRQIAGLLEGRPSAHMAEEAEAKRRKLAEVLCAVAEVYMTDLSFGQDCEERCEALVTEAAMLAPESAEVWQTVASVRLSQGRSEDVKAAVERSLEVWEDLAPEDPRVPDFAVRVGLVRLLLSAGMLEKAIRIAERCVREDDQSVEMSYLGGYALYLLGEAMKTAGEEASWKDCWAASRRWLRSCVRLFDAQEYEDDPLKEHAEELLAEITKAHGETPPDDEDEDEDDAVWDDTDTDDDDDGDEDGDENADEDME